VNGISPYLFLRLTNDDADEIGEIVPLHSSELHAFKQMMIERVFPRGGSHRSLFLGFALRGFGSNRRGTESTVSYRVTFVKERGAAVI
jgi:hypothetical protein